MLGIVLLMFLLGSVFTGGRVALAHAEPFFVVAVRMVIAGILLLAWQAWRNRAALVIAKRERVAIIGLALFNIYLTTGFEFQGLAELSAAKTSLIYCLSPFVAAAAGAVFFGERISLRKGMGLTLGLIGLMPVLLGADAATGEARWEISRAEASVCIAAAATAYGWTLMRQILARGVSLVAANGYSMVLGGIFALIHSLATESWTPTPWHGEVAPTVGALAWMIVISNFAAYSLYAHLLRRYTATFLSLCSFATPFFAAAIGWIFLREPVTATFVGCGVIVSFGLLLFHSEEALADKREVSLA